MDLVPTADGHGYWEVAADGGVFAYGDAAFNGSLGGDRPAAPIVGMASDRATGGYWLVAADGTVTAFDAPPVGPQAGPARSARWSPSPPTADGKGVWEVTRAGSVYAYGDAAFRGSGCSVQPGRADHGATADPPRAAATGWWAADGGVYAFGAAFYGAG